MNRYLSCFCGVAGYAILFWASSFAWADNQSEYDHLAKMEYRRTEGPLTSQDGALIREIQKRGFLDITSFFIKLPAEVQPSYFFTDIKMEKYVIVRYDLAPLDTSLSGVLIHLSDKDFIIHTKDRLGRPLAAFFKNLGRVEIMPFLILLNQSSAGQRVMNFKSLLIQNLVPKQAFASGNNCVMLAKAATSKFKLPDRIFEKIILTIGTTADQFFLNYYGSLRAVSNGINVLLKTGAYFYMMKEMANALRGVMAHMRDQVVNIAESLGPVLANMGVQQVEALLLTFVSVATNALLNWGVTFLSGGAALPSLETGMVKSIDQVANRVVVMAERLKKPIVEGIKDTKGYKVAEQGMEKAKKICRSSIQNDADKLIDQNNLRYDHNNQAIPGPQGFD